MLLSVGERHDVVVMKLLMELLMEQGTLDSPHRLVADKAHTGRENRGYLKRRGIQATLARRHNDWRRGVVSRDP
jgi:ADP-ribosylglycohydrolase